TIATECSPARNSDDAASAARLEVQNRFAAKIGDSLRIDREHLRPVALPVGIVAVDCSRRRDTGVVDQAVDLTSFTKAFLPQNPACAGLRKIRLQRMHAIAPVISRQLLQCAGAVVVAAHYRRAGLERYLRRRRSDAARSAGNQDGLVGKCQHDVPRKSKSGGDGWT